MFSKFGKHLVFGFLIVTAGNAFSACWETKRVVKYWTGNYKTHRSSSEPAFVVQLDGIQNFRYIVLDGSDRSNQQAAIVVNAYNKMKLLSVCTSANKNSTASDAWSEVDLIGVGDY
ncbi:MAG: hypothetical protein RL173_96 [Fibrobacterota bacterium]